MLAKFGFKAGMGLGKGAKGRKEPVVAAKVAQIRSLDDPRCLDAQVLCVAAMPLCHEQVVPRQTSLDYINDPIARKCVRLFACRGAFCFCRLRTCMRRLR